MVLMLGGRCYRTRKNDDLLRRKVMNGTVPGEVFRNVYHFW